MDQVIARLIPAETGESYVPRHFRPRPFRSLEQRRYRRTYNSCHAQQLFAAALGYKTFAAYQAAQANAQEPTSLVIVHHVVLDNDMLDQRADELGIVPTPDRLRELIDAAFRERARHARIHPSYAAFEDYLRQYVDRVVTDDEDVNNEMANANYDGVDEVYFDFEVELEKVPVGGALDIDLDGHVGLGLDTERPYAGHIVNVEGTLSVKRLGRQCFGSVDCQVTKANLDTDWGDDDHEDGPPARSTSQAYADLLGLELHEVGNLVDVEAEPQEGHSGEMIYSYVLDFTDYASPEVARRILQRHSSLRIEVGPDFFENVRSDSWPR